MNGIESLLSSFHDDNNFRSNGFHSICKNRTVDSSAGAAFLHHPASEGQFCIQRRGLKEFHVHSSCPTRGDFRVCREFDTLRAAVECERVPGGVTVYESTSNTAVEITRIGAVMWLSFPGSHSLISLEKTLDTLAELIVRSASVTMANWRMGMQLILQGDFFRHEDPLFF